MAVGRRKGSQCGTWLPKIHLFGMLIQWQYLSRLVGRLAIARFISQWIYFKTWCLPGIINPYISNELCGIYFVSIHCLFSRFMFLRLCVYLCIGQSVVYSSRMYVLCVFWIMSYEFWTVLVSDLVLSAGFMGATLHLIELFCIERQRCSVSFDI